MSYPARAQGLVNIPAIKKIISKKKIDLPRAVLDLTGVEKEEVVPDSAAPKCDFLIFVKNNKVRTREPEQIARET